jgi:hypothetical protein
MSTITVDTMSDVVNANDGVTSLREAIAQAGAGDTIAFALSLDHQTITLAQGLALSRDVIIDGDRNNDGLADITFNGQSNGLAFPIITVTGEAHVVIDGVILTGGGTSAATGASGADGVDSSGRAPDGENGHGREDNFDGRPGEAGGSVLSPAGDGEGFGPRAGAIANEGFLTLRNVEFVANAAAGGNGGNGGAGGDGRTNGPGGDGGNGVEGHILSNVSTTIDFGLFGSLDIDVPDPFNASDGGDGGAGGAGASGGNGGDGGSAAGAIVNFGALILENVSFRNNAASGGTGGTGGNASIGGDRQRRPGRHYPRRGCGQRRRWRQWRRRRCRRNRRARWKQRRSGRRDSQLRHIDGLWFGRLGRQYRER